MKWKNLFSSLLFLAVGIAICIGAWRLGILEGHVPRAGFMPFLTGVLISGLSLLLLILAIAEPKKEAETKETAEKEGAFRKIGLAIFTLILPIFLINLLGFPITVLIFLFLMFKLIERQKLASSILSAFLIAAGFYILFQVLLEIPFPRGVFGF